MSLDALRPWLAERLGATDVRLGDPHRPSLNGMSNDTSIVAASWRVDGRDHEGGFVVRRTPSGPSVYHVYDLEAQYLTMAALERTEVPVPPLVGYERDLSVLGAPFYVMHQVKGEAPPDVPPYTMTGWVLESSAEDQAALYARSIAMLARVHRLPVADLAVDHLPRGFDVELDQAEAWFRWAAEGREYPVLEATLAWLRSNRPSSTPPDSLQWGDARIGNLLYEGVDPVCVLDWEMAAVGPAEVDLGWWLFVNRHHSVGIGFPQLPGFPDDEATIAAWEAEVGRPARDVRYYDVFAGFRFGIIVLRDSRRAIERGDRPEDWGFDRDNTVTGLLARMLEL